MILQEDPDIIEGDEEEVGITGIGITGEELLRQRYSMGALTSSQNTNRSSATALSRRSAMLYCTYGRSL